MWIGIDVCVGKTSASIRNLVQADALAIWAIKNTFPPTVIVPKRTKIALNGGVYFEIIDFDNGHNRPFSEIMSTTAAIVDDHDNIAYFEISLYHNTPP